jgi:hypothetical protein
LILQRDKEISNQIALLAEKDDNKKEYEENVKRMQKKFESALKM